MKNLQIFISIIVCYILLSGCVEHPSSSNWYVSAVKETDDMINLTVCAGDTVGRFYILTPNNKIIYRTYVNPNTCSIYHESVASLIETGDIGLWSASIYDTSTDTMKKSTSWIMEEMHNLAVKSTPIINHCLIVEPYPYGWTKEQVDRANKMIENQSCLIFDLIKDSTVN